MSSSAEQVRAYRGPALFSYGFRPFFLFGALWAAVSVALWLPLLSGHLSLPSTLSAIEWHVHELIFGYVPAVVAGFLLTAVPNWTGRLPIVGRPLAFLFAAWLAGRAAVLCSAWLGAFAAAVFDLSFLALLCVAIGREVLAARNQRNFKVLGIVAAFATANAVFHAEAGFATGTAYGERLGLGAALVLIMLIGGRITPSFTRNWLAKQPPGPMPSPSDRVDAAVLVVSGIALAAWVVWPVHELTGWLAATAAVANLLRLARWAGWRTATEPLVLVLHAAFAFVPLGFALVAVAIFAPDAIASTGAVHAWTIGAIGGMTLAVMTRASLGHTGSSLTATPPINVIFGAMLVAVVARLAAAFDTLREPMLQLSVLGWITAFGTFVAVIGPLLVRPRA